MNLRTNLSAALTLALAITGTTAFAHHGSNGQFDHEQKVLVSGVVTDIRIVNPHAYVYFDVVGDAGETQEWRCEMRAASRLRSQGWTEDMFATGTTITIEGSQARREEFGCYTAYITFENGLRLERAEQFKQVVGPALAEADLAPGTPVLHGRWQAVPDRGYAPSAMEVATAEAAWPAGVPARTGRPSYPQSEQGRTASAGFTREMNPRFHCEATNIFHDWVFNAAINEIGQSDDQIVIKYGFMDIVRTIHLNMDQHPDNIVPSLAGHSIGRWEGNTLVVDTIGFAEGWLSAAGSGVKNSDQMHVIEKFDLSEDDQWMVTTYTVNDPLYLTEPFIGQATQGRSLEPFNEYICEDLTEERVEGF